MKTKTGLYYLGAFLTILGTVSFIIGLMQRIQNPIGDSYGMWTCCIICLGATLMNTNNIEKKKVSYND